MREYKHTQVGYIHVSVLSTAIMIMILSEFAVKPNKYTLITVAFCTAMLLMFSKLTVRVGDGMIEARFGVGIYSKRIRLADIENYAKVRNPWYYGLGIRFTPRGWLYNVYGLSAIELLMKDGKTCRIGTNDPDGLAQAIRRALNDL